MDTSHILFLTRKFPPSRGGMETFSYELTQRYPGSSEVVHYGHKQHDIIWAAPMLLFSAFSRRKQVNLIHLGDLVLAPLAPFLKRWFKVPVVATAHALELTHGNRLLQWLINRSLPDLTHIVAVSDFTKDLLISRGVSLDKISVITHGIEPPIELDRNQARATLSTKLKLTSDDVHRPLLLTVGRLVKRKGVAWFIENVLDTLGASPIYLISSDGPDKTDLEKLATTRPNVRLLGKVDDMFLSTLYAGTDIFIMPNIDITGDAEGFGFVAIEAAAHGLPVVAARLDGIPNAIHDDKNGKLVTPGAADEFIYVINQWVNNPQDRQDFGQAAKAYTVRHFSWDDRVKQYQELFLLLLKP